MFRSPLSEACCDGLSDNQLLQLASCRKDAGVLAFLQERKRLAIEAALPLYRCFYGYTPRNVTIVTAWRTWRVAIPKDIPLSQYENACRFLKTYARACFIQENRISWTFDITSKRLRRLLKGMPGLEISSCNKYALWVKTTEANAVDVARLILEKC